jgi:CDP-diacylglycerol--serine O-phosphatidyltransferase
LEFRFLYLWAENFDLERLGTGIEMHKIKRHIPNIVTFIGLSIGVLSILFTVLIEKKEMLFIPCVLIIFCAFADFFDGRLARLFSAESDFGKNLDSFSDLICFGIASACVVWKYAFAALPRRHILLYLGGLSILYFIICATFRLARYNTATTKGFFHGVPLLIGGGIFAWIVLFFSLAESNGLNPENDYFTPVFFILTLILMGSLMISRFRLSKLERYGKRMALFFILLLVLIVSFLLISRA